MKKVLAFMSVLCMIVISAIPCSADDSNEPKELKLSEVNTWFLDEIEKQNIEVNDTTVFSCTPVFRDLGLREEIVGSAIVITTRLKDNRIIQAKFLSFSEDGRVLPLKLSEIASASKSGYGTTNGYISESAYNVTTIVSYYTYNSSSTLYIRPYSAAFTYYYNSGYSGTFSGTFSYYTGGEKCSYPGFAVESNPYTYVITVTKTNAAQRTNYQTVRDLGYGHCISQYEYNSYGIMTVTRNGSSMDYYVNTL